jgi:ABC-type lipoprotein export system ATPase subunit
LVTHDAELAKIADEIFVIKDGEIVSWFTNYF